MGQVTLEMWGAIIRSVLLAGGVGAFLDGNQVTAVAGGLAAIGAVIWSVVQKRLAATKAHGQVETAVLMMKGGAAPERVIALSKAGLL